jgi:hypothetical protein
MSETTSEIFVFALLARSTAACAGCLRAGPYQGDGDPDPRVGYRVDAVDAVFTAADRTPAAGCRPCRTAPTSADGRSSTPPFTRLTQIVSRSQKLTGRPAAFGVPDMRR